MTATAPLLAALLGAALPGLRALDLGPPALFPWLAGTRCGIPDADALSPAETALLRRFRHPDGRALFGFDRAADAALLAGAPAAWDDAPERLIRFAGDFPDATPAPPPPAINSPRTGPAIRVSRASILGDRKLGADIHLLVSGAADEPAGLPRARLLLLLGAGTSVERHDLLVPVARLEAIHAALRGAAEAFAARAVGGRWSVRTLAIAAGMASVALLPDGGQAHQPPLSIPGGALVHDAPEGAGPGGLLVPGTGRLRVLLGAPPPARVRVVLRGGAASRAALFGEGRRLAATVAENGRGESSLDAEGWAPGQGAAVLGVAAPPGTALLRLELVP